MSDRPGFLGYRRPDGRVGVRNHVLVVPTVICAAVVAERLGFGLDPDALLWTVSDLVKERFGLYHAHFYLMNETGDDLVLAAADAE